MKVGHLFIGLVMDLEKSLRRESFHDYADVCKGIDTANNDRFLRFWWEINKNEIPYLSKGNNKVGMIIQRVDHIINGMEIYG